MNEMFQAGIMQKVRLMRDQIKFKKHVQKQTNSLMAERLQDHDIDEEEQTKHPTRT
jgi:hypothetical protein